MPDCSDKMCFRSSDRDVILEAGEESITLLRCLNLS